MITAAQVRSHDRARINMPRQPATEEEFFAGHAEARGLYELIQQRVNAIGATERRVSKSQIAFRRRRAFAWVWRPGQYLGGKRPPLVLTLAFPYRDSSPRWKEIVEPRPGTFIHHLELSSPSDMDAEVQKWLQAAWDAAA
jgi:hypothetical protein